VRPPGWIRPSEGPADRFQSFWRAYPSGDRPRHDWRSLAQRAVKYLLWLYMRLVHGFTMRYHPELPRGQPYIAVMSHTSFLDVPALMVADPYDPPSSMVIKQEMTDVPLLGRMLRLWGAIPVARRGRDIAALRQIRRTLAEGRGLCVAPQGTRSVDGRVGPVDPTLARLIVQSDAVVFPVVIVGSREALPKGAAMIRPHRIYLDSGPPIDLSRFRGRRLSEDDLRAAAGQIRAAIDALLPEYMRSRPDTPLLAKYGELSAVSDQRSAPAPPTGAVGRAEG
jgi:1-acyl-sn-glycerol-3-phosphate acyltransferase